MRNNNPTIVTLPVEAYESLIDELDDRRIELTALERLNSFDRSKAISHDEMMKRFAGKD